METAPTLDRDKRPHTRGSPCLVCGGCDDDPRGQGSRCWGFLSSDGEYAHCTREDHAGPIALKATSRTYPHKLHGKCPCGASHGPQADDGHAEEPKKKTAVQDYLYEDEGRNPLYLERRIEYVGLRTGKKSKRPHTRRVTGIGPDGAIESTAGKGCMRGVRLVPYHLPELIAADPSETVFVVEGPKKAEALRELGFVATCNVYGAGKWRDEYSPFLAGRHVVILPDNNKVGLDHADAVAASAHLHADAVCVVELPGLAPDKDVLDWLAAGGSAEGLRLLVAKAPAWSPRSVAPKLNVVSPQPRDTDSTGPGDRPSIEVSTERHVVAEEAVKALGSDPDLYVRGDALVKVVHEGEDSLRISTRTVVTGLKGSPKIVTLSDANVGCLLTSVATFFAWKKDAGGEWASAACSPPDWLIKAVATRKYWPGVRRLAAVAECPFPRPDGSIVEAPGYDRETATLYMPSIEFPAIPARPSQADAARVWDRIRAYVREFPFASEEDRVVYLAGVLTIVARPAIVGPVPGIAVNGNKAGTGKGLLVDAMVMPGTGRRCPTMTYPQSKEEAVKVKVSIAKGAKVAIHFDNLEEGASYGSGPLDSALTSPDIDDRQLGGNDAPSMTLRSAWFLSGNNVAPCKDAYRRWLVANLRTELDRPEERTDIEETDLRGAILEHRGEIVRDVLTILKAHALAGRPGGAWGPMGSFEDWDLVVRGAVWFATGLDCLATQRRAAAESPDRAEKTALLEGLAELPGARYGQAGVTAQEAIHLVEKWPGEYETLRNYLASKGFAGKLATSRQLGYILRSVADTPIGRFKLRKSPTLKHGMAAWMVEEVAGWDRCDRWDGSITHTRDLDSYTDVMVSAQNGESHWEGPGESHPSHPSHPRRTDEDWTMNP